MSEIMRLTAELSALAEIEDTSDELNIFSAKAVDGRGCEVHRVRSGVNLGVFAMGTYQEASERRQVIQSYMLTLVPTTLEEATVLLTLAHHLKEEDCIGASEEVIASRAFYSVIKFLESQLPPGKRERLKYAVPPSCDSWQADVADIKAAADKFLRPLAPAAPTTISN